MQMGLAKGNISKTVSYKTELRVFVCVGTEPGHS